MQKSVMGVLQARLVLLAFIGLSAVISYNAIFLQNGPRKTRYSVDIDSLRSRAEQSTASIGQTTRARLKPSADTTVRAIQKQLASKGYDPGPADGLHGSLTRAAILAFQHDNGLPVTGVASDALLKQIIFGAGQAKHPSGSPAEIPEETTELIKAVQQILAKMGYDPGPVDGIMGAGTGRAIRDFERQQKLPVTGRVSGKLLKELVRVTGINLASLKSR